MARNGHTCAEVLLLLQIHMNKLNNFGFGFRPPSLTSGIASTHHSRCRVWTLWGLRMPTGRRSEIRFPTASTKTCLPTDRLLQVWAASALLYAASLHLHPCSAGRRSTYHVDARLRNDQREVQQKWNHGSGSIWPSARWGHYLDANAPTPWFRAQSLNLRTTVLQQRSPTCSETQLRECLTRRARS